jgi:hypothetical protein
MDGSLLYTPFPHPKWEHVVTKRLISAAAPNNHGSAKNKNGMAVMGSVFVLKNDQGDPSKSPH